MLSYHSALVSPRENIVSVVSQMFYVSFFYLKHLKVLGFFYHMPDSLQLSIFLFFPPSLHPSLPFLSSFLQQETIYLAKDLGSVDT